MKNFIAFLIIVLSYNVFSQTKKLPVLSLGTVKNYQIAVEGVPFDINENLYSKQRRYFTFKNNQQQIVFLWQDLEDLSVKLTTINSTFSSQETKILKGNNNAKLLAASTDSSGFIYYLMTEEKKGIVELLLNKTDFQGKNNSNKTFYSFANTINIFDIYQNICSMKSNGEQLQVLLSRRMFKSSDGLNHQAGLALTFNCKTLESVSYIENTTSHSFENYLTVNSKNEFLGLELGDGYPRGINLQKISNNIYTSRVVYTYKTLHSTAQINQSFFYRFPLYKEISTPSVKYYKWSNDNNTYSSLGGIIEVSDGYIVLFIGEPSPTGKSLDNSRAGKHLDPQNIGLVKVHKDFNHPNENVNCMTKDIILSKGVIEEGGFYSYGGEWSPQRNIGIEWLTNYKNIEKENAKSLKCIKLIDGTILILWEKYGLTNYSENFIGVFAMKINEKGEKITPIISLGNHFRLQVSDEILNSKNQLYLINGVSNENKINLTVINLN